MPNNRASGAETQIEVTPEAGGILKSADNRVVINFPPGAARAKATAKLTPDRGLVPKAQFDRHPFSFNVEVRDAGNEYVGSLDRPVTLEVSYTDHMIRGLDELTLALYFYDEKQKLWVKLPSSVDLKSRKVTATTTHFTDVGLWGEPFLSKPSAIQAFESDLFTGSAAFSLPLEVIPGTNGLQPRLNLWYSSGSVDEMKSGNSRGSWVGVGWHLGLGSIGYDPERDKFFFSLSGVSDELIQGSDGYYHTRKETFLRIQRVIVTPDDTYHQRDWYWEAWDKGGTYYRFGYKRDRVNGEGGPVDGSRHFYPTWEGSGGSWWYAENFYRWDLDIVRDTHGNEMTVTYQGAGGSIQCEGNAPYNYDVSSYPYEIKYASTDSGGARRTVRFYISQRTDVVLELSCRETHKLDAVEMRLGLNAETLVRKYVFTYYDPNRQGAEPGESQQLRLWKVQQLGSDGSPLPAYEFTYQNMTIHYKFSTEWIPYTQPRLVSAKNGYGGSVTLGYHEASAGVSWNRQVLDYRTLADGVGGTSTDTYTYQGDHDYLPPDRDAWEETEFHGFNRVTITDAANNVSHYRFHQGHTGDGRLNQGGDLLPLYYEDGSLYAGDSPELEGRPYEEDRHEGGGAKLSYKLSYWSSVEPPGASGTLIRFVALNETKEYTGARLNRTTFEYDAYGNLTSTYEWGEQTSSWYRSTVRIHDVNTAAWILDRVTQEAVYDPSGQWQSCVYNLYDRNTGMRQAPGSKGELWWVRKVSRSDGNRFYTVDTKYTYDAYGNRLSETGFTEEGYYDYIGGFTNENPGLGQQRATTYTYDSTYHTFKMTETTPLAGLATSFDYHFGLGRLTRITDPNNAVTAHSYDVFGRRIATWLPGDDPGQPGAATITYRYLVGGNSPLRMQVGRRKDAGGGSFGRRAYEWRIYDGLGRLIQTQTDFDRSSQVIHAVDINELRAPLGIPGSVTAQVDRVQAAHFTQIRDGIQGLWSAAGLGPLPNWSCGVTPTGGQSPTPIFGSDMVDLRHWVKFYQASQNSGLTPWTYAAGTVVSVILKVW
ncbi:MAG: hypothetical protein M1358_18680 [Chloroflexi bacterium]|nr:hypothetical protein [Chloroflexota bacterium]